MLRKVFASALAGSMLFSVGCIRSASLIKLNEDGSGEIVEQVYLSPQITSMMGGASSMFGEMAEEAGAEAAPAPAAGLLDQFREQAEAKVGELGEGVTLKDLREVASPDGWKGYRATYAFTDINTLTFTSDTQGESEEGEDAGGMSMKAFQYRFEYKPGHLRVINPSKPEIAAVAAVDVAEAPAAEDGEDPFAGLLGGDAAAGGADAMAAGMMQAMGGMFAGMRVTVMLELPKPIKETNASFPHADNKRVIVLTDLKMDALMTNPAAMSAMENEDLVKLRALNIEGVQIEDPTLDIDVKF